MKHFYVGQNAEVLVYVSWNKFFQVVHFADNKFSTQLSQEFSAEHEAQAQMDGFDHAAAGELAARFGDIIEVVAQPDIPVGDSTNAVTNFPPEMGLGILAMQELEKASISVTEVPEEPKEEEEEVALTEPAPAPAPEEPKEKVEEVVLYLVASASAPEEPIKK